MLTSRMKVFAAAIVAGKSQREAAIAAGYSARSASVRASRLMANEAVVAEIARLRAGQLASYEQRPADPLSYLLSVMRDPTADERRRDRMAIAAAPFLHRKVSEGGKKDQRKEAADAAATGRFAPGAPPKKH